MKYTQNAIFTRVRTAVLEEFPNANCTQTYSPTPTKFPTVYAREIGRFTPYNTVTLSNEQEIDTLTWEVQIHSNLQAGAKEQAYAILDAVRAAMRQMYFPLVNSLPLDETNAKHYTLVARFRRDVGGGEDMP